VSLCAKLRVPITVRGAGTGNYGQAVPLQGGVVLDMSGYNQFLWARDGAGRAQAGIRLSDLEKATPPPAAWNCAACRQHLPQRHAGRPVRRRLRRHRLHQLRPARRSRGNVLGIKAITFEEEPKLVELRGAEALLLHHMWGTNGLVLEVELALAPALRLDRAPGGVRLLRHRAGLRQRGVAQRRHRQARSGVPGRAHPRLPEAVGRPPARRLPRIDPGRRARQRTGAAGAGAQFGGKITYRKTPRKSRAQHRTLLEYTWNHTTLNALKVDKTLTYLQSAFTPASTWSRCAAWKSCFAGEVLMHAEFIRNIDGHMTCTALQIVRFTTEERLQEIMQLYRDNGVRVNDPHVFIVEDGKAGGAGARRDRHEEALRPAQPAESGQGARLDGWGPRK
jgi:hypothetical protein